MVLVTGASGFVGRELCRRLRGKGRVRALYRRPAEGPWDESVCVDLATDADLGPALEGVDTVFHLAARTDDGTTPVRDTGDFHRVNFEGTRRLFDAAAAQAVKRFVYASSVKAMGAKLEVRVDEETPDQPTSPYGMSKRAAESFLLSNTKISHVSVVRASPVYGAGSKGNLARLIRTMGRGFFPPLPDVKNARSMVHVQDLADALILCAEREEANRRVFIVTDGRPYSTREIYDWICEALGRTPPRWSVPLSALRCAGRLGDAVIRVTGRSLPVHSGMVERLIGSAHYDSTLIERTLGFHPKWDLRKALPGMVQRASEAPDRSL
jgi:UDP-glucose 4-epimerase